MSISFFFAENINITRPYLMLNFIVFTIMALLNFFMLNRKEKKKKTVFCLLETSDKAIELLCFRV